MFVIHSSLQLLFDPEIFFFGLLPPIIFYAGYSLQKVPCYCKGSFVHVCKQEGYCSTTFQSEDIQLVTAEDRNVILHVSATRKSTNVLQNVPCVCLSVYIHCL